MYLGLEVDEIDIFVVELPVLTRKGSEGLGQLSANVLSLLL